ncbi:MAG TPA: hypothetical protein VMZ53_04855 [Kofleriaceae bacterium]|nr:hypothetical protein [Kofleriaceae bacterium]
MWRLLVVLVVAVVSSLVGCGRVSFDALALDSAIDARPDAPIDAAFGPPQLVAVSSSVDEEDPSLTDDMLEMYFDANPGLVRVTRTAIDQPWSSRVLVMELGTGSTVNNAKISGDGLALYFTSRRVPSDAADIWYATRPDRTSLFSAPQLVGGVQTSSDEYEPMAVGDGHVIYFSRAILTESLWRASRASTMDPFADTTNIPELDSPAYEGGIWVSADERVAYFHSDRVSSAERMIFRASRADASDPFGTPVAVSEIDLPGKLEDPWLSPDGHTLYFASDTSGQYDIYMATR